eukprot:746980-Ditylum_brightwellii.AAC.1
MILAAFDEEITFPTTLTLLEYYTVWVADTGASCDSKGSHICMTNKILPSVYDGVALSGSKVKRRTMIADIKDTVYDKNGSKVNNCLIKNVKYCHNVKYNLFNFIKRIKKAGNCMGTTR